jgi:L-ascorbate metabolism protein UlaG (beta-lactamase superfamily)
MKITWLGHSALKIEGSRVVFVDPFPGRAVEI